MRLVCVKNTVVGLFFLSEFFFVKVLALTRCLCHDSLEVLWCCSSLTCSSRDLWATSHSSFPVSSSLSLKRRLLSLLHTMQSNWLLKQEIKWTKMKERHLHDNKNNNRDASPTVEVSRQVSENQWRQGIRNSSSCSSSAKSRLESNSWLVFTKCDASLTSICLLPLHSLMFFSISFQERSSRQRNQSNKKYAPIIFSEMHLIPFREEMTSSCLFFSSCLVSCYMCSFIPSASSQREQSKGKSISEWVRQQQRRRRKQQENTKSVVNSSHKSQQCISRHQLFDSPSERRLSHSRCLAIFFLWVKLWVTFLMFTAVFVSEMYHATFFSMYSFTVVSHFHTLLRLLAMSLPATPSLHTPLIIDKDWGRDGQSHEVNPGISLM